MCLCVCVCVCVYIYIYNLWNVKVLNKNCRERIENFLAAKRASPINKNSDNNNNINITDITNSMSTQAQYFKQGNCLSFRK